MRSKTKPTKKGATILKLVPPSTRHKGAATPTPVKTTHSRSNGTTVRPSRKKRRDR